jgi:hypothetical protein
MGTPVLFVPMMSYVISDTMMRKKGSCVCRGSYKMARRSRKGRRADGICPPPVQRMFTNAAAARNIIAYTSYFPRKATTASCTTGGAPPPCVTTALPPTPDTGTRIFSSPPSPPPSLPPSLPPVVHRFVPPYTSLSSINVISYPAPFPLSQRSGPGRMFPTRFFSAGGAAATARGAY